MMYFKKKIEVDTRIAGVYILGMFVLSVVSLISEKKLEREYDALVDKYNSLATNYNQMLDYKNKLKSDCVESLEYAYEKDITFADLVDRLLDMVKAKENRLTDDEIDSLRKSMAKFRRRGYRQLREMLENDIV